MKKLAITLLLAVFALSASARVEITTVGKASPTNEIFMDMALTAALASAEEGNLPSGAVVILNGAWKSTGKGTAEATAEENAIKRSRLKSLKNATIFTINEPTTEAYKAIINAGADAVYFVNPREAVIAAGIYPAEAYNDDALLIDGEMPANLVPMYQMDYPDATALIQNIPE